MHFSIINRICLWLGTQCFVWIIYIINLIAIGMLFNRLWAWGFGPWWILVPIFIVGNIFFIAQVYPEAPSVDWEVAVCLMYIYGSAVAGVLLLILDFISGIVGIHIAAEVHPVIWWALRIGALICWLLVVQCAGYIIYFIDSGTSSRAYFLK